MHGLLFLPLDGRNGSSEVLGLLFLFLCLSCTFLHGRSDMRYPNRSTKKKRKENSVRALNLSKTKYHMMPSVLLLNACCVRSK